MKYQSQITSLFLLCAALCGANAAPPEISRVEPPNWWAGHSANPVRLMFSGNNLSNANVTPPTGFAISNLDSGNARIFCDVFIPAEAKPGARQFTVSNSSGKATASFHISPALDPKQRFAGFSRNDVIYLLMPDRFANGDTTNDDPAISRGLLDRTKPRDYHGGDFQGIINHLDYLRDLGVTTLWLTPWYDNVNHPNTREKYTRENHRSPDGLASTDYHGYGAVDFFAVEEHFGNLAKLRELVDTAHSTGMKVIQDQVANHTGPFHPWVEAPPTPTWFNGNPVQHLDNSWQTWTVAERNPPADKLKSTLEGWFINILPDLNQNDPETARYLIQNSLWWIGMTGVDSVRQDTLPYVPRTYWSQWTAALKRQYPNLTVLGEMFDANPRLVSFFQGGRKQFDGVDSGVETLFDFPLYFTLREVFGRGAPMNKLAETLSADTNYVNASRLVTFIGLHDTPRFMSESKATLDQLELAFTFLCSTRGTPMIYYGDEIAMNGGGDPYNRADFPGGWPGDKQNAFTAEGRTLDQQRIHQHVRKLLKIRRELASLRHGETLPLHSSEKSLAYARLAGDDAAILAFNNAAEPQTVRFNLPAPLAGKLQWFNRLDGDKSFGATNGVLAVEIPPHQALLLTPHPQNIASTGHESAADKP